MTDAGSVVAVPVSNGLLSAHFGHCEGFCIFEVDPAAKSILSERMVESPPHQPGLLPRWLAEQGVDTVIAGGMGGRAIAFFQQAGIQGIVGAPAGEPRGVVQEYVEGRLRAGENVCDQSSNECQNRGGKRHG